MGRCMRSDPASVRSPRGVRGHVYPRQTVIEILVVFNLVGRLRKAAAARGASEGWAALGPLLWFGGEVGGFFVAGAFGAEGLIAYLLAIAYAVAGRFLSIYIVDRVPRRTPT